METGNLAHEEEGSLDDWIELIDSIDRESRKSGPRYVLVVDDEPSVRRMVSRSMTSLDKEIVVHEAENGEEALNMLKSVREIEGTDPILIVTDLQMPIMDGWEFIDRLWEDCQVEGRELGVPLIVLSSSSGVKGKFLHKSSVHGDKCPYRPLATIAKEDCIKPVKYDSKGEQGLVTWIKYFLRHEK